MRRIFCSVLLLMMFVFPAASFAAEEKMLPFPCVDTYPFSAGSPILSAESVLPMHEKLFYWLQNEHRRDASFTVYECQSPNFRYRAEIKENAGEVISFYRASNKMHATIKYLKGNVKNAYFLRDGLASALWKNGKPQAREYYCAGASVGFRSYFNPQGKLVAVSDFSKSDYSQKSLNYPGRHRVFTERGGSLADPPSFNDGFLEIYDLSKSRPKRIRFMSGYAGTGGNWRELSLSTNVATWTMEGDQGAIEKMGFEHEYLINSSNDYAPFWAHFQRDRLGVLDTNSIDAQTEKILRCPVIDEAMSFAKTHPAFHLPILPKQSEEERKKMPHARALACIKDPNTTCLLAFALKNADQGSYSYNDLPRVAKKALQLKNPTIAQSAIDKLMPQRALKRLTSAVFGDLLMLKVRAFADLGKTQEASALASDALAIALTPTLKHEEGRRRIKVEELAILLAQENYSALAQQAYDADNLSESLRSKEIKAQIALSYLRAGTAERVPLIIEELRNTPLKPQKWDKSLTGRSASFNQMAMHGNALAMRVRGALEGAHQVETAALLSELKESIFERKANATKNEDNIYYDALAEMYAQLGLVEETQEALSHLRYSRTKTELESVLLLCEAKQVDAGLALLEKLPSALRALGLARCGKEKEALSLFLVAKQEADKTPSCRGDVCGDFAERGRENLADQMIRAGGQAIDLADELKLIKIERPSQLLDWALAQGLRGKLTVATNKMAAIENKTKEPNQANLHSQFLQVEGAFLASQKKSAAALQKWHEAIKVAQTIDSPIARAEHRIALAQAFEKYDQKISLQLLDAAIIDYDSVLAGSESIAGMYLDQASRGFTDIARRLARLGQFARAEEVSEALLNNAGFFWRSKQASDLIDALEMRLLQVNITKSASTFAPAQLSIYPPSLTKLRVLDELRPRLATSTFNAEYVPLILQADAYLDTAQNNLERRQMLAIFANWLRDNKEEKTARTGLETLINLAPRISEGSWQARVLCELGFSAQNIAPEWQAPLFTQGISFAAPTKNSYAAPATGACAFWLQQAGEKQRASALMDEQFTLARTNAERTKGFGNWIDNQSVLDFALIVYESEQGEMLDDPK